MSKLPSPLKNLHEPAETNLYRGFADITRGTNVISRLIGWAAGFPMAGKNIPTTVRIEQRRDFEIWHRDFAGQQFSSVMSVGKGRYSKLLCERIGPTKMGMALIPDGDKLYFRARRWRFLGVPLPRKLAPMGTVYETTNDNKFVFHVEIKVPIFGSIVTYHGELDVPPTNFDPKSPAPARWP